MSRPTRRGLLGGGAAALAGAGVAAGAVVLASNDSSDPTVSVEPAPVAATGSTQAGVDRPAFAQPNTLVVVIDGTPDLAALGEEVVALTGGQRPELLPDGAGDLTVLVGLGEPMTEFDSDTDDLRHRAGDVLLMLSGTDPVALELALPELLGHIADAQVLWSEQGHRANRHDGLSRNPLGHLDGIIVPRTSEELAEDVWRPDGSTYCVVRRFRIDLESWRALTPTRQDDVIGRRRADGAPLSGGSTFDQIETGAKSADGSYLVPARAHARAAHPSFTGSKLMLRRSYPFASGEEQGLLFISFQRDLDTFVKTQQRMDETDDLMDFITATESGAFRILPGFDVDRPLGS